MKSRGIISLIGKIRRDANQFIIDSLRSRGYEKLSPSHGDILSLLGDGRSLPMKEIARMINRKKNTVTVLVEKLVQLGYICKSPSPGDSRITLIRLTEKGEKMMPDFKKISDLLIERTYKGITEQEKSDLLHLLEKIWHNLQERNPVAGMNVNEKTRMD